MHVNDSRYAEWVAEGGNAPRRDGEEVAVLGIDCLGETLFPDSVVIRCCRDQRVGARMDHEITRASDGLEAVRARTEWKPADQ